MKSAEKEHLASRLKIFDQLSKHLIELTDEEMQVLIASGKLLSDGIGGKVTEIIIDGQKLIAKQLCLTELEKEHKESTANLFSLPTYYQYGVGSTGFGAWRELASHRMTTDWVRRGECSHFPLMYSSRVLEKSPVKKMTEEEHLAEQREIDKTISYWGSEKVGEKIRAMKSSSANIVVFMEHVPFKLYSWIETKAQEKDFDSIVTKLDDQLTSTVKFMNEHGFLHLDSHLGNILTDGSLIYFADFGLALSKEFDLSESEDKFFDTHQTYDKSLVAASLSCNLRPIIGHSDKEKKAPSSNLVFSPHSKFLIESYAEIDDAMSKFIGQIRLDKSIVYPETLMISYHDKVAEQRQTRDLSAFKPLKTGSQIQKIKIGIITPSNKPWDGGGVDYMRKMGSAVLQTRGYDVIPVEKYPLISPSKSPSSCPQSHYAAAAEIIRMVHEDDPDVLWAMDGGSYSALVANALDEYARNPKEYIEKYSKDPLTGVTLKYGKGAEAGFQKITKKPVIVGYSDVAHLQIALHKHGFPSMYAPTLNLCHPAEPSDEIKAGELLKERIKAFAEVKESKKIFEHKWFKEDTDLRTKGGKLLEQTFRAIDYFVASRLDKTDKSEVKENRTEASEIIEGEVFTTSTTIAASSLGSPWQINPEHKSILMVELMGSPECRQIDHLDALKKAGVLNNVKAIIFGFAPESDIGLSGISKTKQIEAKAQEYGIDFYILPTGKTFGHYKKRDDYEQFTPIVNGSIATIDGEKITFGETVIEGMLKIPKTREKEAKSETKDKMQRPHKLTSATRAEEYKLRELFQHKCDKGKPISLAGKDVIIDLSGEESCYPGLGQPEIYLQSLQNAGLFDNAKTLIFKVSGKNENETEFVNYFASQLQISGRGVDNVAVINKARMQNIDALDLDSGGFSMEESAKRAEGFFSVEQTPKVSFAEKLKDKAQQSFAEKMLGRTSSGCREV